MVETTVDVMAAIVREALPICIVVELTNIAVCSFLRAAFGGQLWFGR